MRELPAMARRSDAAPQVGGLATCSLAAVLRSLLFLLLGVLTPVAAVAQSPGTWVDTGSLAAGHFQGAGVVLGDGRVLLSGGRDASGVRTAAVEIYDPATGLWSSGGSMLSARAAHTATLLGNGKVLLAGGDGTGTVELFDPALGTSTPVGAVSSRGSHTATLLLDGRVLIAGGQSDAGALDTTFIYDPAAGPSGTLSAGPALTAPRQSHAATLLADGRVLIAGGTSGAACRVDAELFDPGSNTIAATGSMGTGRCYHSMTLLTDGRVLAVGGARTPPLPVGFVSFEQNVSPGTDAFSITNATGPFPLACSVDFPVCTEVNLSGALAVETTGGHVDVAVPALGPGQLDFIALPQLEFAHGTVLSGGFLGTISPTAVDLSGGPNGVALSSTVSLSSTVVPGANEVAVLAANAPLASAEVYTPGTGQFTAVGSLVGGPRALHTATLLLTGEVLIAGGTADDVTAYATAELFGATGFRSTGAAPSGRRDAVALRLSDGRVLVAGGGTTERLGNVLPAALYAAETPPATPGSIAGTVTQGQDGPSPGAPISGATVTVWNPDNGFNVATSTTDTNGNYTVGNLPPRTYKVLAEANGFATRFFSNQTNLSSANLVTVNAGATTGAVNFALPGNAGGITGRVTLADGATGVANAQISVRTTAGDQVIFTSTNASGNYSTQRRLGAGSYIIRVSAAGFPVTYYVSARSVASATPVAVTANADTSGIDVRLTAGVGGISGRVTSAGTGAPLASVGVSVFDASTGGFVQGFTTDAGGLYDTGQSLAPGQYKVTAGIGGSETIAYNNKFSVATGDPVTVTAGNTATGVDMALPLLGAITGHVRNAADNSAISGATVRVFDYGSVNVIASATTADDGSYTLSGLNPLQAFSVIAFKSAGAGNPGFGVVWAHGKPSPGTADVITVQAGGTTTLDFSLTAGGAIAGRVTDGTNPIQGVIIDMVDGASTNFSINNITGNVATTDANGNFRTGRLFAPGSYKVRARKFNSGFIWTFYTNPHADGFDLSTATPVSVTSGADTTLAVDIVMTMGGTITGTIRDRASNQPIAGATVNARRVAAGTFFGDFSVATDQNGNYRITGLHPGEWLVAAQATGHIFGWYSGDPNNLGTDFSTSKPIQITGTNAVANVNLNLQLGGGQIRGRVTRSDNGQAVPPGTFVNLRGPWPRGSSVTPASALTNAQGDYSISGIPPGKYIVEAERVQVPNGTAIGFYPFGSVSRVTGVPVTVTDGAVVPIDFQVLGFSGNATPRSIRGTLRDPSNQPIRNARVYALEPNATGAIRYPDVFDDGSFVVDGLAPGRYLLSVQTESPFAWSSYPSELTTSTAALIDVTSADATGINFVLPYRAGTITGTVTRSDNGQPVLGASIGVRTFLDAGVAGGTSGADGGYLARGVVPGFYKVRVSAPGFVTKFFKVGVPGGALTSEEGSFVTVTSGTNTPSIDVALDPTGRALTGTVRRQDTLQPVVATVAVIHDAATGNRVTAVTTDATGTWRTEGLGPGTYKVGVLDVQAARHAARWYSGESTLLAADPVTVASVGLTGGIDFLVSPDRGSISGRAFLSDGETPLPSAAIEILDAATGGLVRRVLTGSDGRYSAQGLASGSNLYVARARALGFADQFYPAVPTRATATPLTVSEGVDTPGVNFTLTQSSDITGTISYGGAQAGALRVGLFADPGLTQQVYETVIPSPSFAGAGQPYQFMGSAPDTRGLLPGTYHVKAFLDSNANGFQDPTEAFGQPAFSVGLGGEGTIAGNIDFALSNPPATTNTPPTATPQTVIVVQGTSDNSIVLNGTDAQTADPNNLTYNVVTSPLHGTLGGTANPQERLYTPSAGFSGTDTFTFTVTDRGDPDNCGAPGPNCAAPLTSAPAMVTIQVTPNTGTTSEALSVPALSVPSEGEGPTIGTIGDIRISENATGALQAGSAIRLTLPGDLTFNGTPSLSFERSNGAAPNPPIPILESPSTLAFTLATASTQGPASILVSGMSVAVPSTFLPSGVTSAAVVVTISGPNLGLTAASVQNATALAPEAGPVITDLSPGTAAQGATERSVTITGANFDDNNAVVSFGPGVQAAVTARSRTQITATLDVDAGAALGPRDVTVTNVNATPPNTNTKRGAFEITAPPTISIIGSLEQCDPVIVPITGTNFLSPTTAPLLVEFSGTDITVTQVGYTDTMHITATVNALAAAAGTYEVTVTNPDGGRATGSVTVEAKPCSSAPPPKTTPTSPPRPPTITGLTPGSGPLGGSVVITGSGFSSTSANDSVTFAGPNGVRVTATVIQATSTSLTVTVPPQATTGTVTVAVNGVLSNGLTFSVTTPVLGAVLPGNVTTDPAAVKLVPLTLSGSRFAPGATVRFGGPAGDITPSGSPIVSADGTTITLTVSIPSKPQQLGPRDVTVTNPGICPATLPTCLSSTLAGGLQIQVPPAAGLIVTLPDFPDPAMYLPTVDGVSLTRLLTGACDPTTKVVKPHGVKLRASLPPTSGLTPPASVTFTIVSSAIPGTATNENCELDPSKPSKDWSVGQASPDSQQVLVPDSGGGQYETVLYSYDWGGKVTITVTGPTSAGPATGTLALPVDTDGDDLPDCYERPIDCPTKNKDLNLDQNLVNVLNFQNPDQNGNGIKDRDDRFTRDGLSNFEKYRGVYLVGPAPGTSGAFDRPERLGAGVRHLFVRGRGFRNDPAVPSDSCGLNATGTPVLDATLSPANPCPAFQIGRAFDNIGVRIHDVTSYFTLTPSRTPATELPRASLLNPAQATLDMVTVIYDASACKGTEACSTTSKLGVRQWLNSTLGYTPAYGTATTYGTSTVFKRAIESYFNNRPYQHRSNDPSRVVTGPDGRPMLAPITIVGDCSPTTTSGCGTGTDNGVTNTGEVTVSGQLAGDTYIPGSFGQQLTAFDVNNDGCVELPTVADPTTISGCLPGADSAASPSATKQQVVRSVITHELGHATGVSTHTDDPADIMYRSTINYTREDRFGSLATGLIQIHNKGTQ